jgi:Leucine-rich repeat (LRR) protein
MQDNKLVTVDFQDFPSLVQFEARGNQIRSTEGIKAPLLSKLYLADNRINEIKDLNACPKLTHIYLRNNLIHSLEGIQNGSSLQYINLRYKFNRYFN